MIELKLLGDIFLVMGIGVTLGVFIIYLIHVLRVLLFVKEEENK